MKRFNNYYLGLVFFCAISVILQAEPEQTPIPIEDFFADSDISNVSVAPNGRYIAWLAPVNGFISLMLFDLETGKPEILAKPDDDNILDFFWKGNDQIVYGGELGGNESVGLKSVNLKTRKFTALADSYRKGVNEDAAIATLISSLKFDPKHILIAGRSSKGGMHTQVSLVDARDGRRVGFGGGEKNTYGWVTDNQGAIRAQYNYSGEKISLEVRVDDRSSFYSIGETPSTLGSYMQLLKPLGFAADNTLLYVLKYASEKAGCALYAFNTQTRSWGQPLYSVTEGDLSISLSWDHSRLLSITHHNEQNSKTIYLDAEREILMGKIESSLSPDLNPRIVSSSQDEKILVISTSSDTNPKTYFLLDIRRKPQFVQLGRTNSRLNPAALQTMQSISYTARDGLVIHGYLTLPRNSVGKRVPLIINPHGGPYGIRDQWGFNQEVQFLANRGYAVLQPNYRGSGGYGAAFLAAGQGEWGRKMQDDLSDAVKWAIDQGIADPERIAIYGASYGGYAALAGATFTPNLYRCAINYVGVSDLSIITSPGRLYGDQAEIYRRVWVGSDREYLFNHSPVNFVERIRIPTLHSYGENDPRVVIKHWIQLESALKRYHKPYEFIREENEGHGFRHESARIAFYKKMEQFLALHMAPRSSLNETTKPAQSLDLAGK